MLVSTSQVTAGTNLTSANAWFYEEIYRLGIPQKLMRQFYALGGDHNNSPWLSCGFIVFATIIPPRNNTKDFHQGIPEYMCFLGFCKSFAKVYYLHMCTLNTDTWNTAN